MAYVVPPINEELRFAMGDAPGTLRPVFVYETVMPAPYISELMGMSVESIVAAPVVQAGEILNTSTGDFVRVQYSVAGLDSTTDVEVTQVDVGSGSGQLQTVVSASPVNNPVPDDEEEEDDTPPPPPPPPSLSVLSLPPATTVQTTVHPVVPDDTPSFQTAAAAGSSVVLASGFTYTASGTASATADLIGYGELDVNGNPVQTVAVVNQSNLAAAYDGV